MGVGKTKQVMFQFRYSNDPIFRHYARVVEKEYVAEKENTEVKKTVNSQVHLCETKRPQQYHLLN